MSGAERDTRLAQAIYRQYATFFDKAERERRWNPYRDLPWEKINPETPEALVLNAETFCCVESYLPDYVARGINVVRKSFGQAYINMGGGFVDVMGVWTTGEIGFVDPAVAVSVVHNTRPDQAGADYAERIEQMSVGNSPYDLTAIFAAHAVFRPNDTRAWLLRMLSVFARRAGNGVSRHALRHWPVSL